MKLGPKFYIILAIVLFVLYNIGNNNQNEKVENEVKTSKPLTNQEKAESFLSGWDGSYRPLIKLVKDRMNDPESFEHVETRTGDYGDSFFYMSMKYRGKNGFGGIITRYIDVKVDYNGNILSVDKEY